MGTVWFGYEIGKGGRRSIKENSGEEKKIESSIQV